MWTDVKAKCGCIWLNPKDIEKLAMVSETARKYGNNYDVIPMEDYTIEQDDELSFHPNGKCGCLSLDDGYAFGIRCNHLIWVEGHCEGIEHFWKKSDEPDDDSDWSFNTILLIGNHKGGLRQHILAFHKDQEHGVIAK